jgi:hypothetical protein
MGASGFSLEGAMSERKKHWTDDLPRPSLDDYKWSDWAFDDLGIAEKYGGNLVVCRDGEVIAFGTDAEKVMAEAMAKTGLSRYQLILTTVLKPGQRDAYWK